MADPKVYGMDEAVRAFRRIPVRMVKFAQKVLKEEALSMTSHIKDNYLRGGTSKNKLAVRSGHLIQNTHALPVTREKGRLESGTGFYNTIYAPIHIGPKGQVTTIRPVNKKWLTIPLDAAKTSAGVSRGSALSGRYGDTFFQRDVGPDGKTRLILYGRLKSQRGASAGQTRGKIVPLFLLVKQVKIKTRVHPEEILAWEMPRFIDAFREVGIDLKRG